MTTIAERLAQLNIVLPDAPPPVVNGYEPKFVPYVRSRNQICLSGRLAKRDGEVWRGKLGAEWTAAEGQEAARGIAIELVAVLRDALRNLERVKRIARLLVLVNATSDFELPHVVANGASELLLQVFGERGAHARTACCVAQLPFGACVEIEMVAEVEEEET
ncbi:MAG TPA: RidA family protein [Thermoanaerobaculia bacterium]|nr:RidA family protein [Thermoanaerobaculia bacterium]